VLSRTVLIATEAFGEQLGAERAAAAIGRGLRVSDPPLTVDLCPLEERGEGPDAVRGALAALDFDRRMRSARAVVIGAARLDEQVLLGSATFEIATRARQTGVPAYAVTGANALDLFDARILDLQVVLRARDTRTLRRAGEKLAELL
jgi:glycerate kinase